MLKELGIKLKNEKLNKTQAILKMLNSNKYIPNRETFLKLSKKHRPQNTPKYEDRVPKVMELFNYCLKNGFSFYKNLNYICNLISTKDYYTLDIHKEDYKIRVRPFSLKQLEKYDSKLYTKIVKEYQYESTDKIVLGLSNYLAGVTYYDQNGLFTSRSIKFQNRIVYFGLVRKGDKIDHGTFRNLVYFNW